MSSSPAYSLAARCPSTPPIGSNIGSFFDAVGSFFDSLSRVGWVSLLLGAVAFVIYLTLRSRAFFHTLRAAYPGRADPVSPHLGRVHRRLRLQQRHPGARRRRHQAVSRQALDPARDVSGGRRGDLRRGGLRRGDGGLHPHASPSRRACSPSRRTSRSSTRSTCRSSPAHPQFTLFVLTALAVARARRLRGALAAGQGVLGARAPGADDPPRPPPLPARGVRLAVRAAGAFASRRSGFCSRRSTSAARCATCCSCSASTRSRRSCRSRPAARACSRRCS